MALGRLALALEPRQMTLKDRLVDLQFGGEIELVHLRLHDGEGRVFSHHRQDLPGNQAAVQGQCTDLLLDLEWL